MLLSWNWVKKCDLLYVIEIITLDVQELLKEVYFKFVNPKASPSEYCDCFSKSLMELSCTPLMTMDVD